MRIAVFGTGYVGLVTGVCLADLGNDVVCVDIDEQKIARLRAGECIIFEPGLAEKLSENLGARRLSFTADAREVQGSEIIFIAVGTPSATTGEVDVRQVEAAARLIGAQLARETIVVIKSTVPVGTSERARRIIGQELRSRGADTAFHMVSNPEFLREGAAVRDFFTPDRIVVGLEPGDAHAREAMEKLYDGVARTARPVFFTDTRSAELVKYASNAMLAARISFMNQLCAYCEATGADITAVAKGIGLDTRIGPRFLHAGIGYGGSCFPKDVKGLIAELHAHGCDASIFEAVERANEAQKRSLLAKLERLLPDGFRGSVIAVWGLSFKPKTDDVREAPSQLIVDELVKRGAQVRAFDPEAAANFRASSPIFTHMHFAQEMYAALEGADALLVLTEWDAFRNPDWGRMRSLMRSPRVLDGRNIYLGYRKDLARLGFTHVGIGVAPLLNAEDGRSRAAALPGAALARADSRAG